MIYNVLRSEPTNLKSANKLVGQYLARSKRELSATMDNNLVIWDADFYNLSNSKLFLHASEDTKINILQHCGIDLIFESYLIEKIGMAYSAKLVLLAESLEEKQLFSFIGCDEATHLNWIAPYLPLEHACKPAGSLLNLIQDVVTIDKPNLLYYLIQIVLEGWGLRHYANLGKNCLNINLQNVFKNILKDEALHHNTGKVFFSANRVSKGDYNIIKDVLKSYCDLVRVGPQAVAKSILTNVGSLTLAEATDLFVELDAEQSSRTRLELLKQLMLQPGMSSIVMELDDAGYFKPYDSSECARVLLAS